jgi:hypothetical protein
METFDMKNFDKGGVSAMQLIVYGENEGRDVLEKYIAPDNSEPQAMFKYCLPSNDDSKYSVSMDGKEIEFVEKDKLWDYPIIEINQYCDGGYEGINQQGISLLAFNVKGDPRDDVKIQLKKYYPSYVATWKNRVQIIFKIRDFIPITMASDRTIGFLELVIRCFETQQDCMNTNELLNPFCPEVTSYTFNADGLSLGEIMHAAYYPKHVSPEAKKLARGRGGIAAAKKRKEKSIARIIAARQYFELKGKVPTQSEIAERAGLSRKTVNKWQANQQALLITSDNDIQYVLNV